MGGSNCEPKCFGAKHMQVMDLLQRVKCAVFLVYSQISVQTLGVKTAECYRALHHHN